MIYAVTLSGDVQCPLWSLTLQLTLDSELGYKWIAIPHPKNNIPFVFKRELNNPVFICVCVY